MSTVLSRFGNRCRQIRLTKNVTMGDQAKALNCPVHEISSIECGILTPSQKYLEDFRNLMQLDDGDFIELTKKIRSNIVELKRVKSTGNKGRSIRLFRQISNMNPEEIRKFRKPPESETLDGR